MRSFRVAAVVVLLLVGCRHKSEEEKLVKALGPAKSWAASLAFMGQAWLANRVPTSLLKHSVDTTRKEIGKARKAVDKSKAPDALRSHCRGALDQIADAAASIEHAVETHDVRSLSREIARCRRVYSDLDALEEAY
jgi:hypothetical protein